MRLCSHKVIFDKRLSLFPEVSQFYHFECPEQGGAKAQQSVKMKNATRNRSVSYDMDRILSNNMTFQSPSYTRSAYPYKPQILPHTKALSLWAENANPVGSP